MSEKINRMEYDDVAITTTFEESTIRRNLTSGENLAISLGKVKKYFNDLGDAAFVDVDNELNANSTNPVENALLTRLFTPMTQADYDAITNKDLPIYFIYEI